MPSPLLFVSGSHLFWKALALGTLPTQPFFGWNAVVSGGMHALYVEGLKFKAAEGSQIAGDESGYERGKASLRQGQQYWPSWASAVVQYKATSCASSYVFYCGTWLSIGLKQKQGQNSVC